MVLEVDKVISALKSKNRRRVLRVLSKYWGYPSNALTLRELISDMSEDPSIKIKHRESIYKDLEKLVDSGLVEKFSEIGRGMCYRIVKTRLEIDLINGTIK